MTPTANTTLLDEMHAKGLAAAQAHFEALVACMASVLPDGVNDTIPKTLVDVAGLFSASTETFYLTILPNAPGYQSLSVVFEIKDSKWAFKKFSVMIGDPSMFSLPREYVAHRIEDALVLSKQIAKYQEKYAVDNIPMPQMATARPN